MSLARRIGAMALMFVVFGLALMYAIVSSLDPSEFRQDIAASVKAATGRNLEIKGPLRVHLLTLNPSLVASDVTLGNPEWASRAAMAEIKELTIRLDLVSLLDGELRVRSLQVLEPDILLETNGEGLGNWVLGDPAEIDTDDDVSPAADDAAEAAGGTAPAADGDALTFSFEEIRVEKASIGFRDAQTGRIHRATLGAFELRARDGAGPMSLAAEGVFRGLPVQLHGRLDPLRKLLAVEDPYTAQIALRVDESDVSGTVKLSLRDVPTVIDAHLKSFHLNLDRLDLWRADNRTPRIDEATPPLPIAYLRAAAVRFRYEAQTVTAWRTRVEDLSADVRVRDGKLTAQNVRARAMGGRVTANMTIWGRKQPASVAVALQGNGLSLERISNRLLGAGMAAGRVKVHAELSATGRTATDLLAGLSGHTTIQAGQGELRKALFDLLSRDVLQAISIWAPTSTPMALHCLVGAFQVKKGIAYRDILLLDTARAHVIGRRGSWVDLRNWSIDVLLDPYTKDTSLATLVSVPLRVFGSLDDPSVSPDPGATLTDVASLPFRMAGGVFEGAIRAVGSLFGHETTLPPDAACRDARLALEAESTWPDGWRGVPASTAEEAEQPVQNPGFREHVEEWIGSPPASGSPAESLESLGDRIKSIFE